MRYATARYNQFRADLTYRVYLTDSVQMLAQGKCRKDRFIDLLFPKPVDDRPPSEIVNDILSRAGVEVKKTIG